ncbi:MAG TPA: DUF2142 domain-containing protein [Tepidisphaeraceae bacterium]|nr:DUF2142 domain-containing protein [Tepidisphaeraceae bacterium]
MKPARWTCPIRLFPLIAIVLGVPMALLTAPFQAPDEPQHFGRAYQISEGGFLPAREGNRGGAVLPESLGEVYRPFARLRFNRNAKTSFAQVREALSVPLNPSRRSFVPLVTSIYSPAGYLPQACAIAVGRSWNLPPLALLYLARIANLFAWVVLGSIALRALPRGRRAFLLLLLMPMSLFQAASASPDATTNGLAVLFAAMVLRFALYNSTPATKLGLSAWIALAVVSSIFTLTKFAYAPLAALVLLIPSERFGGAGCRAAAVTLVALINLAVLLLWSTQTRGLNTVVRTDDARVSPHGQVEYLRSDPAAAIAVPATTFVHDGWLLFRSFVGRLGSMDTPLWPPFLVLYFVALVLACWPSQVAPFLSPRWVVPLVLACTALSIEAVALLNYIYWTPVGARTIEGMQGRYFLPVAPALLIACRSLFSRLPPSPWNKTPPWKVNLAAGAIAAVGAGYALVAVYFRYY